MTNILLWIRSFIFTVIFYVMTVLLGILFIPTLFLPAKFAYQYPIIWSKCTRKLLYGICGVKVVCKGLENLPKTGGYIIASKHQSALETTIFHSTLPNIFYVLKRELIFLPIAGLFIPKVGCVGIDRKGGAVTMRKMLSDVKKRLEAGKTLIIFPEGTRTAPGTRKPYSPGIALLYEQCNVPVVPVALNTGYCWPKNKTKKIPGTITIEFLKPIEPGLHRRAFLSELEDRIEEAVAQLPAPFKK